jgi:purine-nucleoside phosphorylase
MTTNLELIAEKVFSPVDVAIILGSGLGAFAETLEDKRVVNASELPGYPVSTVAGHAGKIVTGNVGSLRVLAFQGRVHLYEGYAASEVVTPVRLAHRLGAKILVVTNASGAVTRRFKPGDLLLIDDHINLQFRNPLRGMRIEGEARFPDCGYAYDRELCLLAERVALAKGITLQRGVFAGVLGPTYETPAETRMLARLGGDAASMSTVAEVICSMALGMSVLGISCVTNWSAGISELPLDHDDVQRVAGEASERLAQLITGILEEIGKS